MNIVYKKYILFQNQMYPAAGMYHKPSPAQQHRPQYNTSGKRIPIHRSMTGSTGTGHMSGPTVSMRNLNLGKRT